MNIPIDISDVFLQTERLLLRPWQESDLDDLYEYASVDGVGQMAGWLPHDNKDDSAIVLNDFIEGKKTFALEYQGKVIGSLGIEKYNETAFDALYLFKGRELGFVLSKEFWGQGLMVEACKVVMNWLFEGQDCDFVICGYFKENNQSKRVQEKLGFQPLAEGILMNRSGQERYVIYNIIWKQYFERFNL